MADNFLSGLFGKKQVNKPTQDQSRATEDSSEKHAESKDARVTSQDLQTVPVVENDAEERAIHETKADTTNGEAAIGALGGQGWLQRLGSGLSKSSSKLSEGVTSIFRKRKLDDETLEELEDLLISADLGVTSATAITAELSRDKFDKEVSEDDVREALARVVASTLKPLEKPLTLDSTSRPHIILVCGVNGAGKTTTIGKLAAKLRGQGKTVMLAAGDTFRAAAIEQLQAWGARAGAKVITRPQGSDAAGLAYDALEEARREGTDVLLIDTAGRLQNRRELMDELAKIVRVLRKADPTAPHDTLLVLDATVGQNAINQASVFGDIADVTGLVMTKLDGTARGGVLVSLGEKFRLPIHYIGVGEGVEDLQPFIALEYARALAGLSELKT